MKADCKELLQTIYQAGFAMDEVNLYLDTHPCDQDALNYYHYVNKIRRDAMSAYQAQCGPLMMDQVTACDYWTWVNNKWPWEGGDN